MYGFKTTLPPAVLLFVLVVMWNSAGAETYEDPDALLNTDFLQIQSLENEVIAVRDRRPTLSVELQPGERVLTIRVDGRVGGVLTNQRFLAISADSQNWFEQPLRLNESFGGELLVSRVLALLITEQRAVGFDGRRNRMVTYDLPIGEYVIAKRAGLGIIAFATTKRVVGFGAGGDTFKEYPFKVGENFRKMTVSAGVVTVETSERLLTFRDASGVWTAQALPLGD